MIDLSDPDRLCHRSRLCTLLGMSAKGVLAGLAVSIVHLLEKIEQETLFDVCEIEAIRATRLLEWRSG